jgi:hypothetical protein
VVKLTWNKERMDNIFWKAYSNDERHAAIPVIQQAVSKYGDIVDSQLFSDVSLNLKIEIDELKVDELYDQLCGIMGLDKFEYLHSTATRERTIFLNITFNKGTGDVAIEVPAVPG